MPETDTGLLAIYLKDHLGGATGGLELARRIAAEHRSDEHAETLATLATDVEEDRAALLAIMRRLGVQPDQVKVALGWLAEKVARLKFNGRLFERSPLSLVVEAEAMMLGVHGKAAGWRTLRKLAENDDRLDPAEFHRLSQRAGEQLETLEAIRVTAAARVLTGVPAPG
jgi:hypothetical protein